MAYDLCASGQVSGDFSSPPVNSGGARPSFLPLPVPSPTSTAAFDSPYGAQAGSYPSPEPTINMQVEVPVPVPVATSPAQLPSPSGTAAATPVIPTVQTPSIIYDQDQAGVPKQLPAQAAPPFDPGALLRQKRYAELFPFALQARDSALANAVGWSLYNDGLVQKAYDWFSRAIQWNEQNYEAAYGLGLSLFKLGRYNQAAEVARWRMSEYPNMRNLMGDILIAQAVSAYRNEDYQASRTLMEQTKEYRQLTRSEQIMQAWSEFQTGDPAAAEASFEQLYREKRDSYAASGLYAALARLKDWPRMERLSEAYGGPIAKMYQDFTASRYYDRKLYANAYAVAPEKYPELSNFTTPSAAVTVLGRQKTGDSGMSRLREVRVGADGTLYENDINRFDFSVGVSNLDSGHLPDGGVIGSYPFTVPRHYSYSPTTHYQSLVDIRLKYTRAGIYAPTVELGTTPVSGEVSPTIIGDIGVKATQDWGNWQADIYRSAIKESILSYVGIRDPYSGKSWGRSVETGVRFTGFIGLEDQWSAYGLLSAGSIDGQEVKSNSHIRLTLSVSKDLVPAPRKLPGNEETDGKSDVKDNLETESAFSYFTLGPDITLEHFSDNQSYFTYGQGGYFSPDFLLQGMLSSRFMTHEGRNYLVRGAVSLGIQSYRQAETPFFPLVGSQAVFPTTNDQTVIAIVQLQSLLQLDSQWVLGGSLGYNKTADYSEFTLTLSLQYFFESRSGLYAGDFPQP